MKSKFKRFLALTLALSVIGSSFAPVGKSFAKEDSKLKVRRIYGSGRYETSAKIAREFGKEGGTVLLASGEKYADALAGSPLSGDWDAPILLTREEEMPKEIKNEINRLNPEKIYILGGVSSVSKSQEESLSNVTRIWGSNRVDTAMEINKYRVKSEKLVAESIYNPYSFPDALAAGPLATKMKLELVPEIKATKPDYIFGGDSTVKYSGEVIKRFSGSGRYETAVDIAKKYAEVNGGLETIIIASGEKYPDALSSSIVSKAKNAPILLVREKEIPESVKNFIKSNETIKEIIVVGGDSSISKKVFSDLENIYKLEKDSKEYNEAKETLDKKLIEIEEYYAKKKTLEEKDGLLDKSLTQLEEERLSIDKKLKKLLSEKTPEELEKIKKINEYKLLLEEIEEQKALIESKKALIQESKEEINKLSDTLDILTENLNNLYADTENLKKKVSSNDNRLEEINQNIKLSKTEIEDAKLRKVRLEKTLLNELYDLYDKAEKNINNGAFAFFEFAKSKYPEYTKDVDRGLEILNIFKSRGEVKPDADGDAASYENLFVTGNLLKTNNHVRSIDDNFKVGPQFTNFEILSKAIVSANRSTDPSLGHRHTFNVAENLAWGYKDPYVGWYYEEKEIYDKDNNAPFNEVGHYFNIMSKSYELVAIAQNSNPKDNPAFGVTHASNSTWLYEGTNFIREEKYLEMLDEYRQLTNKENLEIKIEKLEESIKSQVGNSPVEPIVDGDIVVETELSKTVQKIKELEKRVSDLNIESEELEVEQRILKRELNNKEIILKEKENETFNMSSEIVEKQEKLDIEEYRLENQLKKLNSLNLKLEEMKKNLPDEKLMKDYLELREQLKQREKEIETTKEKKESVIEELKKIGETIEVLEKEIEQLNSKIENAI
ncbi:MAG: cell wall-binding repeat-containing protein [Lagierella massiliensis]|nr:cell wall-binding repeat-containing protein [Lagierella massiliensis]